VKQPGDDSLHLLQAQWVLGETRADQVPRICTDLLVQGYDTESLRLLAGLTRAEEDRVVDLLPGLFRELGMARPSRVQATWCLVQNLARDIVSRKVNAADGAWAIGNFGTGSDPLFPSLRIFIGLSSEWDGDPERQEEYESEIRQQALRLLKTEPPSEPGTGSEVDRLVQLANQKQILDRPNMQAEAHRFAGKIPAGHRVRENREQRWIAIESHDRLALLLHATLPFGFIRWEYRREVEVAADQAGIQLVDIASVDARQLSITHETLEILAGGEIDVPGPIDWLSANEVRKLTEG
jgi:hypothetical protein